MTELLYGRNAVREALRARRRSFSRLLVSAGAQEVGTLEDALRLAGQQGVPVERVERQVLDKRLRDANHQGMLLEASDYPYAEVDDCLNRADEQHEPALLLLLDHLQDPQNVGTLLRTAEVVGAHGVLLPTRRAAGVTPSVVNASSGATEHLLIAAIGNLAQTMVSLQRSGLWVVGMDEDETAQPLEAIDFTLPLALVVGAEGAGLARLTRERCDFLLRLPMRGQIGSLNAAVAGSIALYHGWRARTLRSETTP